LSARIERSGAGGQDGCLVDVHFGRPAAALLRSPGVRRVYQDAPHHLRRHGEELRSFAPFDLGHVDQAEIDLVD
jgi:hypothetical protein